MKGYHPFNGTKAYSITKHFLPSSLSGSAHDGGGLHVWSRECRWGAAKGQAAGSPLAVGLRPAVPVPDGSHCPAAVTCAVMKREESVCECVSKSE